LGKKEIGGGYDTPAGGRIGSHPLKQPFTRCWSKVTAAEVEEGWPETLPDKRKNLGTMSVNKNCMNRPGEEAKAGVRSRGLSEKMEKPCKPPLGESKKT